ncbi:MAG: hydrogenase expression/formation protein HypE [Chloroflexi bacterium]|nr:hydrogenase expression/formation protein HypE [Chloroflexota bacterium]
MNPDLTAACPLPFGDYPHVLLAHGGGGKLMQQLIEKMFLPAFNNPLLGQQHDGAVLEISGQRLAFTTDSYVVRPLFFPGGDIGTLAVNGTVNDLAMCGARPQWLSAGFILEEGLPMETLGRVVGSMQKAAAAAGVQLVTGDTKVVDKGKGDGLFVNTAGLGLIEHNVTIAPSRVQAGDVILLNGDLGRHGMAIMSVREGLAFESTIESDCAPLAGLVLALLEAGIEIHCLRDLTRGGLASALNEIAAAARVQPDIEESAIPVLEQVQGACEILGLDPLYVANEGRFVAFVPARDSAKALELMRSHPLGQGACVIGVVTDESPGLVTLKSKIGARRILDLLSGEQLPRIC